MWEGKKCRLRLGLGGAKSAVVGELGPMAKWIAFVPSNLGTKVRFPVGALFFLDKIRFRQVQQSP